MIKKLIAIILIVVSILPLEIKPFYTPSTKIILLLTGLAFFGYNYFFSIKNIVSFVLFFASLQSVFVFDLPIRIILLITSLDLISLDFLQESLLFIIDLNRVLGKIFLIFLIFCLNSFGMFHFLEIDIFWTVFWVVILIISDFSSFIPIIKWVPIKQIIIFLAALFLFNFNILYAIALSVIDFFLVTIL